MPAPDSSLAEAKAAARSLARARRRAGPRVDPVMLARRARDLVESLTGPRRVTCYASYGTEPATDHLLRVLAETGFVVLLPRVCEEGLEWVESGGTTEVSTMGMAEPTGPAVDLDPVRALLIPALAVTEHGDRLGKGGGYYDRVLARLPGSPAIVALVGDDDIVDELPTEPHDRRVDHIVTPSRVIDCR